jgi:hypothetical protein
MRAPHSIGLLCVAASVACSRELPQQKQSADASIPAILVARQVEAYNKRDLDGFVATFSPDVEMRTLGSDNVAVRGHKAMREAYQWLLTAPKELHAVAVERIVSGPFVVARLHIEGLSEPFPFDPVWIYEVRDSLIRRVWLTGNK